MPTSFAGPFATNGVVSGTAVNTFDGSMLGPLTVNSRTLTTNYNVADNSTGAQRTVAAQRIRMEALNNVTVKDQVYDYQCSTAWYDSETYAFDTGTVPRRSSGPIPSTATASS